MARVTSEDQSTFECSVEELRPNSVLLCTDRALAFRSKAKIAIAEAVVDGEVVYARDGKLALTFATTPMIFDVIELVDSEREGVTDIGGDVLSAIDDALAAYATTDIVNATPLPAIQTDIVPTVREGVLTSDDPTDLFVWCMNLLSKRPLLARVEGSLKTPVRLSVRQTTLQLDAAPIGVGWIGLTTRDAAAVRAVVASLNDAYVGLVDDGVPTLDPDGATVSFTSAAQYERHHESHIAQGALVVRSPPIAPGTSRTLVLRVPNAEPTTVDAIAMYEDAGTVGFSIRAPAEASTTELTFDGPIAPATLLRSGGATTYLDVLKMLVAQPGRATIEVVEKDVAVRIWLDAGRFVFAERTPMLEEDRLGERLITAHMVSRAVVDDALAEATEARPVGTVLLEQGRLTRADLNRVLRAQTIARATEPVSMSRGTVRIQPWRSPPVRGRLLGVSGASVLAGVVRRCAAQVSLDVVRTALAPYDHGPVKVHLNHVEASHRLREVEMRALMGAVRERRTLHELLTARGLRPADGAVLVLLGHALGFLELAAPGGGSDHERDRRTADLQLRADTLEESTHFETLEVHWAASHAEILAAYRRATQRAKINGSKSVEARAAMARIRARVEEAFATIGARQSRVKYRNELFDEGERGRAAEHLVRQAELAVLREDAAEAERILDSAEELAALPQAARLRQRCRKLREAVS